MSRVVSPMNRRPYGLAVVCRVWRFARSGVYRHQLPPADTPPRSLTDLISSFGKQLKLCDRLLGLATDETVRQEILAFEVELLIGLATAFDHYSSAVEALTQRLMRRLS